MTLLQLAEDMPETFNVRDQPGTLARRDEYAVGESGIMFDFGDGLPAMETSRGSRHLRGTSSTWSTPRVWVPARTIPG